jgi:SAM-dependent methyltransferase
VTDHPSTAPTLHRHFGGENLEVMRDAEKYNRFLRELIRCYAGNVRTALDFGAGLGTFSDSLDIPAAQVHCVEPDATARETLAGKGHMPHASIAELADASVDYVFTLNVLEHIEDDSAAIKEIYRVVKPGGRLLVYVPAFMVLYTSMDSHVGHHRRYRMTGLRRLVEGAGFRVERKSYIDSLGFFATLAYRLFDGAEPAPLNPRLVGFYDRYLFPLSRLLSVPLAQVLGKNLCIIASRPDTENDGWTS